MVLELKGPNLNDLFYLRNLHFSTHTLCNIAIQVIEALKFVHSRGILHRDMKPQNIVAGNWPSDAGNNYMHCCFITNYIIDDAS